MYRLRKIALVALLIFVFSLPVSAKSKDSGDYVTDFDNAIPEDSYVSDGEMLSTLGPDKLFSEIFSSLSDSGGEIVAFFLLLLGIGIFFSISELYSGAFSERLFPAVRAGISAISALLIFSRLKPLLYSVEEGINSLSDFFASLIPIVTGIAISSGAVNSAGIQGYNMNLTLALLGEISSKILTPLVFAIFALALIASVGDGGMARLAGGAKSIFLWFVGIISTVLIAAVSMQSFLASSKDSAALRAAKYALSGSIPMVGSTVSGALGTLSGALSEARAIVGVGAVGVIFTMAVSPIIVLLLYRLSLSLAIWIFDFIESFGAKGLFSAFRSGLDALIAVYALSAIIYIFELVVFMKSGVSVFA